LLRELGVGSRFEGINEELLVNVKGNDLISSKLTGYDIYFAHNCIKSQATSYIENSLSSVFKNKFKKSFI